MISLTFFLLSIFSYANDNLPLGQATVRENSFSEEIISGQTINERESIIIPKEGRTIYFYEFLVPKYLARFEFYDLEKIPGSFNPFVNDNGRIKVRFFIPDLPRVGVLKSFKFLFGKPVKNGLAIACGASHKDKNFKSQSCKFQKYPSPPFAPGFGEWGA
jgi:hypothetical protein